MECNSSFPLKLRNRHRIYGTRKTSAISQKVTRTHHPFMCTTIAKSRGFLFLMLGSMFKYGPYIIPITINKYQYALLYCCKIILRFLLPLLKSFTYSLRK